MMKLFLVNCLLLLGIQGNPVRQVSLGDHFYTAEDNHRNISGTIFQANPDSGNSFSSGCDSSGRRLTSGGFIQGRLPGTRYSRDSVSLLIRHAEFTYPGGDISMVILYDSNNKFSDIVLARENGGMPDNKDQEAFYEWLIDTLDKSLDKDCLRKVPLFWNFIHSHDLQIERFFIKDDDAATLMRLGKYFSYKFLVINENLRLQRRNDSLISDYRQKAAGWPQLYPDERLRAPIGQLAREASLYANLDSIEHKYVAGCALTEKFRRLEHELEQSREAARRLAETRALFNELYGGRPQFAVIFREEITPLIHELDKKGEIYDTNGFITPYGKDLIERSARYIKAFTGLARLDSLVNALYEAIARPGDAGLKFLFRTVFDTAAIIREHYDSAINIAEKEHTGDKLLQYLGATMLAFEMISLQEDIIHTAIPLVVDYYMYSHPDIFRKEFEPLMNSVLSYSEIDDITERLQSGEALSVKCLAFFVNAGTLRNIDDSIRNLLIMVKAGYRKDYPEIYFNEITDFERHAFLYQGQDSLMQKIEAGRQLLNGLRPVATMLDELRLQHSSISGMLKFNRKAYRKKFPVIYQAEIRNDMKFFKEYIKTFNLIPRIEKGRILFARQEYLYERYSEMHELDSVLNARKQEIEVVFRKVYPSLYRGFLKKFSDSSRMLSRLTSPESWLIAATRLQYEIEDCLIRGMQLSVQLEEIQAEYQRFSLLYEKARRREPLYQKGKMACSYFMKHYKHSTDPELCMSLGRDLLLLMRKMNSMAAFDCSYINGQLKELNHPEEVMKQILN